MPGDIDAAIAAARATWPDIHVDTARFAAHLGDEIAERDIADLYLAFACAAGDAAALAALDRSYLANLRGPLGKIGLRDGAIDEVLQLVREELLVVADDRPARILSYSGRGTLHGWLRSVAVRTGLRSIRKSPAHDALEPHHGTISEDPELAFMKKTYGDAFHRAFTTALGELAAKDRLLLKQRYRFAMGVEELAAHYGVHAGTISRWVQAARDALATLTRTAMMTELGIGAADVSSILRLIHSQLEITLSMQ